MRKGIVDLKARKCSSALAFTIPKVRITILGKSQMNGASLISKTRSFIQMESAGGILLLIAAILAMMVANSPLSNLYGEFLNTKIVIQVGNLVIDKPLLLWINDGLMAVFFFLIGLEIKREFVEGELSEPSQLALPAIGALGGMLVPAAIYAWINWGDSLAMDGWAIPVATDIAFALGLLSLFGRRVPIGLKVFLLTLAIFDDLAAIIIIALFYSGDLSLTSLGAGALALTAGITMNRLGVKRISWYIFLGIMLWLAVLKSGVHATLAGVVIAFCIPMQGKRGASPVKRLEHDLHMPVAFLILPLFAFANAGLSFEGMTFTALTHSVTLGVIMGLLVGKPVGILSFVGIAMVLRLVRLPSNVSWLQLLGVAFACGIGFTMSLFIAGLAFEHGSGEYFNNDRLGILVGSILSALMAGALLQLSLPKLAEERPAT